MERKIGKIGGEGRYFLKMKRESRNFMDNGESTWRIKNMN